MQIACVGEQQNIHQAGKYGEQKARHTNAKKIQPKNCFSHEVPPRICEQKTGDSTSRHELVFSIEQTILFHAAAGVVAVELVIHFIISDFYCQFLKSCQVEFPRITGSPWPLRMKTDVPGWLRVKRGGTQLEKGPHRANADMRENRSTD